MDFCPSLLGWKIHQRQISHRGVLRFENEGTQRSFASRQLWFPIFRVTEKNWKKSFSVVAPFLHFQVFSSSFLSPSCPPLFLSIKWACCHNEKSFIGCFVDNSDSRSFQQQQQQQSFPTIQTFFFFLGISFFFPRRLQILWNFISSLKKKLLLIWIQPVWKEWSDFEEKKFFVEREK